MKLKIRYRRTNYGTVLATRSIITGSNRTSSRARAAAEETVPKLSLGVGLWFESTHPSISNFRRNLSLLPSSSPHGEKCRSCGQQEKHCYNSLRANAVDAPDAQDFPLQPTQSQGESKTGECAECSDFREPSGECRQQRVTQDAHGCDRNTLKVCVRQDRVLAMVHDAAIPLLIDATRRGLRVVVFAKRECGDYNSRKAEHDDKGSQHLH